MIVDGLKLALLGMSVVFLFLVLLVAAIQVSARILKPLSDREAEAAARDRTGGGAAAGDRGARMTAVLAAAVAAHRARARSGR